jgi:hypothetical protein
MTRTRRAPILVLAIAVAAFPVVLVLPGLETGVLFLSPAIVLLASLLTGRYIGEERLARLAAAFVAPRRRPARTLRARARRCPRSLPRGGRLIAASLAVRPPPARPRITA